MALPHQFSWRAASPSVRVTRGFEPSLLLRIENMPCVPEGRGGVGPRPAAHCPDVAHAAVSIMTPPKNEASVSHARMGTCLLEGPSSSLDRTTRNHTEGLRGRQLHLRRCFCGCDPRVAQACSDHRRRRPPMSQFLTLHEPPENLRRPIIIMAFSGWNDAAEAATTAARYLSQLWSSRPFASIDPEEFYHFGLSRPYVRFKPGSRTEREIIWPATEFSIAQPAELERDVIVGVAIEPHLKWRSYCTAVLELSRRCRASLVLTLGALLAEVAHTQPVRLAGSAYDPELAVRLGLRPTRYEG